jgi:monofunctional biosynthetic peptidoglycan transglycosylase
MYKVIVRYVKLLAIIFFSTSILAVIVYRFVPVYITPLMVIRTVQQLGEGEKPTMHHNWVSDEHISANLKKAVIASEDQRFYNHWGFDVGQIKKAVQENGNRKKPRGASTISQQTAKNVFLWPKSSWIRKGFESYFTVLIEFFWTKNRILEVYLNSMETGDGIYGAEAVARAHFDNTAENLTKKQAALIAATLPNPIRFNSAHPSSYIRRRQAQIQRQMRSISLKE